MMVGRCNLSVLLFSAYLILATGIDNAWPWPSTPEASSYFSIDGPCNLIFPRDHGAHPGYRTEWWYYTGNLRSQHGKRYGFQLTFFRSQISPPGSEKSWPRPASAWRTQHIFISHAAVSDIDGRRFYHSEGMGRWALGIAGVEQDSRLTSVFSGKYSAQMRSMEHHLSAKSDDFSFDLTLTPTKEPVLHGKGGYSLKGASIDSASCYYSFTRLESRGTMTVKDKRVSVYGTAWMDHEFSSAPLEPDLAGWDWFSLQLEDNTEVMIYLLRQKNGAYSPASSGTFVSASGKSIHLGKSDISLEVLDKWESPQSGARYPSRWRLRVHPAQLDLTIIPNLADQEMRTPYTTRVNYWEGSVSVKGAARAQPVKGAGYVELTGYDRPFDAPL